MGQIASTDYAQLAKGGFLLGIAMFTVGAVGEWAIHGGAVTAAAWQDTLFFDLEVIGVLVFLFVPLVFGIILPLVE